MPSAEIETLRAERASYLDRLARLQAEFDNFRKRSVKEQQDLSRLRPGRSAEVAAADSRQP